MRGLLARYFQRGNSTGACFCFTFCDFDGTFVLFFVSLFFFIPLLNPYSCLISQSMLKCIKLHKVNVSLIDFENELEKKK